MAQSNDNKADRPIRCISCGKVIGQGYVMEGSIQLQCKCGVKTKIEAEKKPAGRQYFIDHEPSFDSRGRIQEISMVLKRTS